MHDILRPHEQRAKLIVQNCCEYGCPSMLLLLLLQTSDLRLDVFARFLSEEWDFLTFLDFLTASAALLQVGLTQRPPQGGAGAVRVL